ncbi:hypothetical protein NMY22_g17190 [Coprinellus aureogranulatus]|nr:hypothetical protein NMY22_g17190 [Coprinellus aureogranulatus]
MCTIPSNPDIAGIGVRIAIYIQNLLCFIPALRALWDGKVSASELDSADGYSTTNLFLAFAILITCMVQAFTSDVTNYHASIILSLSWMNNTSVFVYFLLYIQYKGQKITGPKSSTWLNHIKSPHHVPIGERCKALARGFAQRITLVLGSFHLTLMATLGIWLWIAPKSFGEDDGSRCAFDVADLAIFGFFVPFGREGLSIFSLFLYSLFLIPGLNLLLPAGVFLSIYCLATPQSRLPLAPPHTAAEALPTSRGPPNPVVRDEQEAQLPSEIVEMQPLSVRGSTSAKNHQSPNDTPETQTLLNDLESQTQPPEQPQRSRISKLREVIPVGIGLLILLCINVVFIVDIELTLQHNREHQERTNDEAEWGFGQILAMVLLPMPLRDLAFRESIVRRQHKMQTKLNEPLVTAISTRNLADISRWAKAGADVNVLGDEGQTALHVVCSQADQNQLISLLIEKGADPRIKFRGRTAYDIAIEEGNLEGAMIMAGLQSDSPGQGLSVLEVATNARQWELVHALVTEHPETNVYDDNSFSDDRTVLEAASLASKWDLVWVVIGAGANVDRQFTDGQNVLQVAVSKKQWNLVRAIIEKGAKIDPPSNGQDRGTDTALLAACRGGAPISVIELMVGRGATLNRQGPSGKSCLHEACKNGRHDIVTKLLKHSANPDIKDDEGLSPLHEACSAGHTKCADTLLDHGADIDIMDNRRRTALHHACFHGKVGCVDLLMRRGINHTIEDEKGKIAVQCAKDGRHNEFNKINRTFYSYPYPREVLDSAADDKDWEGNKYA